MKKVIYRVFCLFSFVIRQFFLPNPFEHIINPSSAYLANMVFGGMFGFMAYLINGVWYRKNHAHWVLGSFGFLVNYSILIFAVNKIGLIIHDIWLLSVIMLIISVAMAIIENKLFGNNDDLDMF